MNAASWTLLALYLASNMPHGGPEFRITLPRHAPPAGQSHYLRIYMGHLRQKLEADPTQPQHLLTETAVGYRLVVWRPI